MVILENHPLKKLNTFGISASAKYFTECGSEEEILGILSDKKMSAERKLILGGGSNLLFTGDFNGLVLKNNLRGISISGEDDDHVYVRAAAGEVWHELVMFCIARGYGGIENLSLIPGNVGASPMQNIGAYGVEIKDVFHELEAIHIAGKERRTFSAAECRFGYRESVFKRELKDQFIITSVTYRLSRHPRLNTSYGAIGKELEQMKVSEPGIREVSQAVINIRTSKLPDPKVIGNAGSFFKNPEISSSQCEELRQRFPDIVSYPLENGNVKLAAGWLIEACGWKGKTFGDAGVHKLQALVLVNYGNATGAQIYDLSRKIMDSVKEKFGVSLEREVNII